MLEYSLSKGGILYIMIDLINKVKTEDILSNYAKVRQLYINKFISNIGEIVEKEDKFICYINQKNIDRHKGNYPLYDLNLKGIVPFNKEIEEIIETFGLNKPVYYIFDNIDFRDGLKICSPTSKVIFRNCNFDMYVKIFLSDEITFENNKYKDVCSAYFREDFFSAYGFNKLNFINDNFINSYKLKKYEKDDTRFGMNIDGSEINFINTRLVSEYPATIKIKAKKTNIKKSEFKVNEISLDSKSIDFTASTLIAQNGAIIENADCDFVGNVQAPIVFYNGTDLENNKSETQVVSDSAVKLKNARKNLVDKLRILNYYCQQVNDSKIQFIREKLNRKTIVKTLKK